MTDTPDLRSYQFAAAALAGRTMAAFDTEAQAQVFYDNTGGPLPLAQSMFADDRLVSVFVQCFVARFADTGFSVTVGEFRRVGSGLIAA